MENLCFSKSYFSNGLVTIRDFPITINDVKIYFHTHKVPKKSRKREKGTEVRLSIEDGAIQSTVKKVSMEKDHAVEKEDTIMLQKPS